MTDFRQPERKSSWESSEKLLLVEWSKSGLYKWLVRITVMLLAVGLSGVGRSLLVGFDPLVKLGRSVRNNLRDIVHHFSKFVKWYQ